MWLNIKDFMLSGANRAGLTLGSAIELLHIFGWVNTSYALVLVPSGYALGYFLTYRAKDGTCPKDIKLKDKLQWAQTNLIERGAISASLLKDTLSLITKISALLEKLEEVKLKEFYYAKAYTEISGLIDLHLIPALETYFSVTLLNVNLNRAELALSQQVSLMQNLVQHVEEQLAKPLLESLDLNARSLAQKIEIKENAELPLK